MMLVTLGILGASLFYGDGAITPAISVLSAVEGVKVAVPSLHSLVLPITLAVLSMLFAIQRFGTKLVGNLFGPVMALWFGVLGLIGRRRDRPAPGRASRRCRPATAPNSCSTHGGVAFIALGSVVLAVTGAEALYADMGHFGRAPIRRAWFLLVFPALTLNYLAQGSLIVRSPKSDLQPVLPARARLGADADGAARHRRHGDRLAGGHLGRLQRDPAGGAARLPAAPDDPPHLATRGRADLRAGVNAGAVRRGAWRSSSASAPRPRSPRPTASR